MLGDKKELGVIRSAWLGFEEHGFLTFNLDFDFGGSGQGFGGGYALGGEFTDAAIRGVLKAVGVDEWKKLVGKEMWVIRDNEASGWASGKIIAIEAPAYRENTKSFNLVETFAEIKKRTKEPEKPKEKLKVV